MVDFEIIRQKVKEGDYEISVHAGKRLRQRRISLVELEYVSPAILMPYLR